MHDSSPFSQRSYFLNRLLEDPFEDAFQDPFDDDLVDEGDDAFDDAFDVDDLTMVVLILNNAKIRSKFVSSVRANETFETLRPIEKKVTRAELRLAG
jgi:hypothetical protein